jgi:hypothetical protein
LPGKYLALNYLDEALRKWGFGLYKAGKALRYIQNLPGNKRLKTTEIYMQVSEKCLQKIKSPFDDL